MKLDGLSLEQAPPLSVPLRFFISAPVLAALAIALLLYREPAALASRWHPATLAVTHGLLLGFLLSIMLGAMQQLLPVLAGAVIPRPRLLAWSLHIPWLIGVIALQLGFIFALPPAFTIAAISLGGALALFIISAALALRGAQASNDSVPGMRLALLALFITLSLGLALAMGHSGQLSLLRPLGTDSHMLWGMLGWTALLIMAVAWQVVPMFQVTAAYPAPLRRYLPPALFLLLLLRTLAQWQWPAGASDPPMLAIDAAISLCLCLFAISTLWLQQRRRRKMADSHVRYWQLGAAGLLAAVACWWAGQLVSSAALSAKLSLLAALLYIFGFVLAVVIGMLYKIVAFLVWFHLQGLSTKLMLQGQPGFIAPHMKTIIPEPAAMWQQRIYLLASLSVYIAAFYPHWLWPGALLWLLAFAVMAINLSRAALQYRRIAQTGQVTG